MLTRRTACSKMRTSEAPPYSVTAVALQPSGGARSSSGTWTRREGKVLLAGSKSHDHWEFPGPTGEFDLKGDVFFPAEGQSHQTSHVGSLTIGLRRCHVTTGDKHDNFQWSGVSVRIGQPTPIPDIPLTDPRRAVEGALHAPRQGQSNVRCHAAQFGIVGYFPIRQVLAAGTGMFGRGGTHVGKPKGQQKTPEQDDSQGPREGIAARSTTFAQR